MSSMIVAPSEFNPTEHMIFTKPKVNSVGGKSIGILNSQTRRSIQINTPLMLTWGANVYENQNGPSYSLALQFPREEFSNPEIDSFLNMLKEMETSIKAAALENSKEWFGKVQGKEVIDAFWNPILKYPKGEDGEPDLTRNPTIKVKLPTWEGEYKFELFDPNNVMLLPNSENSTPDAIIQKGSNIACILQCGGIWFANGNFGVSWKLTQGIVKATETLVKGKCHISLSSQDRASISNESSSPKETLPEEKTNENVQQTIVESDEEEEEEVASTEEPSEPEPEPQPEPEKPKKKRVVKKKA